MTKNTVKRGFFVAVPIALLALVLVGLLLIPRAAQADLKGTGVFSAWDYKSTKYENGNIAVAFNGTWIPFVHREIWNTNLVTSSLAVSSPACQTTGTRYAGIMKYTLGYTDTNGAKGFRETKHWRLISCDLNNDGAYLNGADLATFPVGGTNNPPPYPAAGLDVPCDPTSDVCNLISQDVQQGCSQQTCDTEIVTTFFINLDPDCDGVPDILPANGNPDDVCFYAEARTPDLAEGDLVWGGNLQTRITEAGGDKTVNFNVDGWPTAIELDSFAAEPQGDGVVLTWQTATELDLVGFNLYRSQSRGGQRTQVNGKLIASQMPGSAVGAAYSFADATAAKGGRYYYWLEELDIHGGSGENGPAIARGLPRLRPSPMPVGAIQ